MAGVKVNMVTCGIAGEHVSARTSPGVVAVSGDEVTAEDVARVNEVARAISLGRDQELLHDIPQEYVVDRSEEHTSELQSRLHLVCRLLLEKKKSTSIRTSAKRPTVHVRHVRDPRRRH